MVHKDVTSQLELLKRLDEDDRDISTQLSEARSKVFSDLRKRVAAGESTGDPVSDFFIKGGESHDSPRAEATRKLFARVAAHPGEFILAKHTITKHRQTSGCFGGGSFPIKSGLAFGQLADQPCSLILGAGHSSIPYSVQIPTLKWIEYPPQHVASWYGHITSVHTPKDPTILRVNHSPFYGGGVSSFLDHNLDSWRFESDIEPEPNGWLGDDLFEDCSTTETEELELRIGDEEVLNYFNIKPDGSRVISGATGPALCVPLLFLASLIDREAMERTAALRQVANMTRGVVLKYFTEIVNETSLATLRNGEVRDLFAHQVECVRRYHLNEEPIVAAAEKLLSKLKERA